MEASGRRFGARTPRLDPGLCQIPLAAAAAPVAPAVDLNLPAAATAPLPARRPRRGARAQLLDQVNAAARAAGDDASARCRSAAAGSSGRGRTRDPARRREVLAGGGGPPWLAGRAPRSWRGIDFSGRKERQRRIQGGGEVGEEGREEGRVRQRCSGARALVSRVRSTSPREDREGASETQIHFRARYCCRTTKKQADQMHTY